MHILITTLISLGLQALKKTLHQICFVSCMLVNDASYLTLICSTAANHKINTHFSHLHNKNVQFHNYYLEIPPHFWSCKALVTPAQVGTVKFYSPRIHIPLTPSALSPLLVKMCNRNLPYVTFTITMTFAFLFHCPTCAAARASAIGCCWRQTKS